MFEKSNKVYETHHGKLVLIPFCLRQRAFFSNTELKLGGSGELGQNVSDARYNVHLMCYISSNIICIYIIYIHTYSTILWTEVKDVLSWKKCSLYLKLKSICDSDQRTLCPQGQNLRIIALEQLRKCNRQERVIDSGVDRVKKKKNTVDEQL